MVMVGLCALWHVVLVKLGRSALLLWYGGEQGVIVGTKHLPVLGGLSDGTVVSELLPICQVLCMLQPPVYAGWPEVHPKTSCPDLD